MVQSHLSRTTHTIEMAQIDDINHVLATSPRPAISAAQLGVAGAVVAMKSGTAGLPGTAVLQRLCWEGQPQWPDIHGHFAVGHADLRIDLHTPALQELSHRLHLRQAWGL